MIESGHYVCAVTVKPAMHSGLGHWNYGKNSIVQPNISFWKWMMAW